MGKTLNRTQNGFKMGRKRWMKLAAAGLFCLILAASLFFFGVFQLNRPSADKYPIRGVDVSSYQGIIDWQTLSAQKIDFAFIKATEGSSYTDEFFADNYKNALQTDLQVGAYHFFSYDSSGKTQAENFISAVEPVDGMLPPVIDVEFYGDKARNLPDRTEVVRELTDMVRILTEHYRQTPIIYATEKSYRLYIAEQFPDCDIWIRNVISKPTLSDGREWTFWQYTDRMKLEGYNGKERFIDMNVFYGGAEAFAAYCDPNNSR